VRSRRCRVVPYVVEVDRLGAAQSIAAVGADYQPTDPQIAWHLAKFIANVRGLSLDPVLVRENWLSAFDYATDRGAIFLGDYARTTRFC
jgi:type IV secretion system protein TrbF